MESAFNGHLAIAQEMLFDDKGVVSRRPRTIAEAIIYVMTVARIVAKRGRNDDEGYSYVAMGDLLAVLQSAMAQAGIFTIQQEVDTDFTVADGYFLKASYEIYIHHVSGEEWKKPVKKSAIVQWKFSDGYDDKALSKCSTAANKYFLLDLFKIPTGDVPDSDAGHDIAAIPSVPAGERADIPLEGVEDLPVGKTDGRVAAENITREMLAWLEGVKDKASFLAWDDANRGYIVKLKTAGHFDLVKDVEEAIAGKDMELGLV